MKTLHKGKNKTITRDLPENAVEYSFNKIKKEKWITNSKNYCVRLLKELNIRNWEVSILFCNDEVIRELNRTYRGKDKPTDVLAFRQDDDGRFPPDTIKIHCAGDIVISIDTLKKNSIDSAESNEIELLRLLTHAMLHLLGMDHKKKNDTMLLLQEELLEKLIKQKKRGTRKLK